VNTGPASESKIRVPLRTKSSGSASIWLEGGVALNYFGNKTVPRLGPHGNCSELGPRGNPPDSELKTLSDLQQLTQDLRERKATKSDDAAVPLSLWEEHLINDGARAWTKGERRKLGPACDALRKRFLLCWKKKVLAGFRTWLNEKYADTFKIINKTWGSGVKFDNGRYVWREGQAGRDDYLSWWSARMLACPEDLMAWMDAIGRAFRATWWE
jgi:hypothetical protein